MFDKHFVGLDLTGFSDDGIQRPISRVTLMVDDENTVTAGDDSGLELTADCPHATQAMVNTILAQVKGSTYRMFTADNARLDPAAELGDGVTAGGVYSVISRLSDDGSGFPGISASGETELEDEYPAGGPMTRAFDRKIAQTRSSITKTAERITLLVEDEIEGLTGKLELTASSLSSQISATDGRVSAISQTVSSITTRVTGLEGSYSSLEQYVDSITLTVANGSTTSTISLKAGNATIASQTINMTGLVTFTGLSNGTTTINGACIKTGTIDADRINLTGAITFSDLSTSVQNDIDGAWDKATDALYAANSAKSAADSAQSTINAWSYGGGTYIDGNMILVDTIMASKLLGGTVGLLDASQRVVGGMSITNTQTGYGVELYTNSGGIRINPGGNFWVDASGGSMGITDSGVISGADLVPLRTGYYSLGRGGLRWSDVYADNGTIVTSDREKKTDIAYGLDAYSAFFDALRPVSYRLKGGSSGRTHLGLIAQDVEKALEGCGLSGAEFAGFVKAPREGGGADYALRYEEFIALCIQKIHTLSARVAELERRTA